MCTRFYILPGTPDLEYILETAGKSPLLHRFIQNRRMELTGEIRPTDIAPVLAPDRHGNAAVYPMQWGFHLSPKGTLLVNARTETAAVKATFRDDWASHRCIVPASWYFEWEHFTDEKGRKKTGQKYAISAGDFPSSQIPESQIPESQVPEDAFAGTPGQENKMQAGSVQPGRLQANPSPLSPHERLAETVLQASSVTWLCGLYRIEGNIPVFVILTREPGQELSRIHDRMPLILPPEAALEWIRPQTKPEDLLQYSLTEMKIRAAH